MENTPKWDSEDLCSSVVSATYSTTQHSSEVGFPGLGLPMGYMSCETGWGPHPLASHSSVQSVILDHQKRPIFLLW